MKRLNLFFMLFLLLQQMKAQSPPPQPMRYGMLSAGVGMLFPHHDGKAFHMTFNYTSTSQATGAAAAHTFSTTGGPFSFPTIAGDLIRGTWVSNHNSFDIGAGYNQDTHDGELSGYLRVGYGYIFRFGRWQLQPSLDFYFTDDEIPKVANIDNNGVDINLLGQTANAQWSETVSDVNGNPLTYTYNASRLQVDYDREGVLVVPGLMAGTLLWRRLYVGIEGGWLIQLSEGGFYRLTQYDNDHHSNQIGTPNTSGHGSLAGPGFAINAGYCLGGDFHRKKKP